MLSTCVVMDVLDVLRRCLKAVSFPVSLIQKTAEKNAEKMKFGGVSQQIAFS